MSNQVVIEKQGSEFFVHDTRSGRRLKLKGYGSMKGQIDFRKDIDLTKPIVEQVLKKAAARKKKVERKTPPSA